MEQRDGARGECQGTSCAMGRAYTADTRRTKRQKVRHRGARRWMRSPKYKAAVCTAARLAYERAPREVRSRHRFNGRRHRVKRYGLSPEQYDALLDAQGWACAICHEYETAETKRRRTFPEH
jgi:hypothetical protein